MTDITTVENPTVESAIIAQYELKLQEALQRNDLKKVFDLKWGLVFLRQKYGYFVG